MNGDTFIKRGSTEVELDMTKRINEDSNALNLKEQRHTQVALPNVQLDLTGRSGVRREPGLEIIHRTDLRHYGEAPKAFVYIGHIYQYLPYLKLKFI